MSLLITAILCVLNILCYALTTGGGALNLFIAGWLFARIFSAACSWWVEKFGTDGASGFGLVGAWLVAYLAVYFTLRIFQ